MRLPLRTMLAPALAALLLVPASVAGASAAGASAAGATPSVSTAPSVSRPADPATYRASRVVSRPVAFSLRNTNETSVLCLPDRRIHTVRARLVGPAAVVDEVGGSARFNVLVHDAGTGSWFWNLRSQPGSDYATQLARQGETSLVLDRLGYGRSPLADGGDTCLGAQVDMLHQVVQHVQSGFYRFTSGDVDRATPHAGEVVVHGHGTGATIAQVEAAKYHDAAGTVLMSPVTTSPTQQAVQVLGDQLATCTGSSTYAAYGSPQQFRSLLFADATEAVRRAATRLRGATPCGDVTSLASTLLTAGLLSRPLAHPVLVLRGSEDRRSTGAVQGLGNRTQITRRTIVGAGSALPLERSAPQTRATVLRWLRSL